jgi:Secretion system C-terminal sorting domain
LSIFNGGVFTNNSTGIVNISNNAADGLSVWPGAVVNNAGAITLTGNVATDPSFCDISGTINNTGTFSNSILLSAFSGSGTFNSARYTNPSGAQIGSAGLVECITFTAGLTNSGVINIDLGAGGACVGNDQITVTGASMIFGGTFTATGTVTSGTYTLMTYPSRTGTFANTSAPLGNGRFLNIRPANYGATTLTGVVENFPALPIELLHFDATTEGAKNTLTWATASEINSQSFDIERSSDGVRFSTIGNVEAQGKAADYSFVDNNPLRNTNYYRLKAIDNDQSFEYSKIVSAKNSTTQSTISIYPTLVSDWLTIATKDSEVDAVTILNHMGQLMLTAQATNRVDMSQLASGIYFVQVQVGSETVVEKVVKQ